MLDLTRRLGHGIAIGDAVEVTVIEVRGDAVRLGISAPRRVGVQRKGTHTLIQQENAAAAASDAPPASSPTV